MTAAWRFATRLGAHASEHVEATGLEVDADGVVHVKTATGETYLGRAAIVAPGAWLSKVSNGQGSTRVIHWYFNVRVQPRIK